MKARAVIGRRRRRGRQIGSDQRGIDRTDGRTDGRRGERKQMMDLAEGATREGGGKEKKNDRQTNGVFCAGA